ncbi:hypothetical protein [Agarivorans sp. JK6]|uniref:hypothetical protein n=1 Tax=Agarivorans sp. JK6 TaxID=2997426 RepID=UPI0038733231
MNIFKRNETNAFKHGRCPFKSGVRYTGVRIGGGMMLVRKFEAKTASSEVITMTTKHFEQVVVPG